MVILHIYEKIEWHVKRGGYLSETDTLSAKMTHLILFFGHLRQKYHSRKEKLHVGTDFVTILV